MYDLYNNEAFEGCLPTDMEIKWDSRLTKTAGTCSQAGKLDRKTGTYTERKSSINLSIKVNNEVLIVLQFVPGKIPMLNFLQILKYTFFHCIGP